MAHTTPKVVLDHIANYSEYQNTKQISNSNLKAPVIKEQIALTSVFLSVFLIAGATACRHSQYGLIDKFALEVTSRRIAFYLDLDESQEGRLQDIITELANEVNKLCSDHNARCRAVAELMRQDVVDRDSIDQMIAAKFAGMQAIADLATDRQTEFHASLTPEPWVW